jgi:hypothetical protein
MADPRVPPGLGAVPPELILRPWPPWDPAIGWLLRDLEREKQLQVAKAMVDHHVQVLQAQAEALKRVGEILGP